MTKKLYKLDKGSQLKVKLQSGEMQEATFHHIDGMYSYCTLKNGGVFHLSASTPMILIDGFWHINNEV